MLLVVDVSFTDNVFSQTVYIDILDYVTINLRLSTPLLTTVSWVDFWKVMPDGLNILNMQRASPFSCTT